MTRFLVLGGYGTMGRIIVRDLAESGAKEILVAGRDESKAAALIEKIGAKRAAPAKIDATDPDLEKKIREIEPDVLVNATWYEYNMHVMPAAIRARVHYVDLGGLYHMTLKQLKLSADAKKAGVLCVLGMGSTPGTTNVMAAYGADEFDRIGSIRIVSGSKTSFCTR